MDFGEDEPTTEVYLKNQDADTTFEQCGWCNHKGCGSYRLNCMISGGCNLGPSNNTGEYGYSNYYLERKSYNDKGDLILLSKADLTKIIGAYVRDTKEAKDRIKRLKEQIKIIKTIKLGGESLHIPEDFKWDTPCMFKNAEKRLMNIIIGTKEREIKFFNTVRIPWIKERVATIQKIRRTSTVMPIQSENRSADHFNVGDDIMRHDVKLGWIPGKVVNGYRHHDGCVTYHVETGCCCGIEGPIFECTEVDKKMTCGGSGMSIPHVLLKSEYDYFTEHPEDWFTWIKIATDRSFNGEYERPELFKQPEVIK